MLARALMCSQVDEEQTKFSDGVSRTFDDASGRVQDRVPIKIQLGTSVAKY